MAKNKHYYDFTNELSADEIYEVANKVLNNPTIHILKSSQIGNNYEYNNKN